jgi:hypothetical protein
MNAALTGMKILNSLAARLRVLVPRARQRLFGPEVDAGVLGSISRAEMKFSIRLDAGRTTDGECGHVGEITQANAAIHAPDKSRRNTRLSHFIENPIEDRPQVAAQFTGAFSLWVDYSVSFGEVLKTVRQIVEINPVWDGGFWSVHVADANQCAMLVRVLVSAADSTKTWDLRCEVLERLVAFIEKRYPGSLLKARGYLEIRPVVAFHRNQEADRGFWHPKSNLN